MREKTVYKRIITGVICLAIVSLVFFGGRYLYQTMQYKDVIAGIEITTPDLSRIDDGTYDGSFDAGMIAADVRVGVADSRITDITIVRHKNDRGSTAERITDEVLAAQSLKVDTITGATNSSKVILKAIERALDAGTSR